MSSNPLKIAIEGFDGSGKTTITDLLYLKIPNSIHIKAPSDPFKVFISHHNFNNETLALLYEADRVFSDSFIPDDKESVIVSGEKLYVDTKVVFYDRCYLSTLFYQNIDINFHSKHFDQIYILDTPYEICKERLIARNEKVPPKQIWDMYYWHRGTNITHVLTLEDILNSEFFLRQNLISR